MFIEPLTRRLIGLFLAIASVVAATPASSDPNSWPDGTEILPVENLEGIILVSAKLRGTSGRDTAGTLVLDSGAGYLALDRDLTVLLGLATPAGESGGFTIADRPLRRLELGALQMDQISPVIGVDMEIVRRATDRPILGLLGQLPLASRAVLVDYTARRVALIPMTPWNEKSRVDPSTLEPSRGDTLEDPSTADSIRVNRSGSRLRELLSPEAVAVPFRLVGDGKILISARVSAPHPPRFGNG